MKNLKTLIKLNKHKLDEISRSVSIVLEQKDLITKTLEAIDEQLLKEQSAHLQSDYMFMLEKYLKNAKKIKDEFNTKLNDTNNRLNILQEAQAKQFAEVMKFEIALKNKQSTLLANEKKEETKQLDEIASHQNNKKSFKIH